MELSDNHLVTRILAGEDDAFTTLVERYSLQVYNLMYRYSGSNEEATDMTQDVFCKIYEKLENFQGQGSFFPWLYTTALNHARDCHRKRSRQAKKLLKLRHEPQPSTTLPGERFEIQQDVIQLQKALETLSDDRREMVILRYRHEHSIRELAAIFQLSESAVKMRLQRSLIELGKEIEGAEYAYRTTKN